jgi:hypothetical protein
VVKGYKTDLLIFANMNGKIYVFENRNVDASGSYFKIPAENLINEIE